MKNSIVAIALICLLLLGCERHTTGVQVAAKADGAPPTSLTHDQLTTAYLACTQYGQIDDPKVPYTVSYCAAIQSAILSEGYVAKAAPRVDPTLTKMH